MTAEGVAVATTEAVTVATEIVQVTEGTVTETVVEIGMGTAIVPRDIIGIVTTTGTQNAVASVTSTKTGTRVTGSVQGEYCALIHCIYADACFPQGEMTSTTLRDRGRDLSPEVREGASRLPF